MQLWLVPGTAADARVPPPYACPHAGCDGRRFRRLQAVAKPVRDARALVARGGSAPGAVTAVRYACRACGRSFRVYPPGVDRGDVAAGIKRFAAALHFLGLSYGDVGLALGVLGVPLSKSRVHAVVAPRMRGLARRSTAPLLGRVEGGGGAGRGTGADDGERAAASVAVGGRRLTLRRAVDARGRVALVIEDVDRHTRRAVEAWVRGVLKGFEVEVDVVFPAARPARMTPTAGWVDGIGMDGPDMAGEGDGCVGDENGDGDGGGGSVDETGHGVWGTVVAAAAVEDMGRRGLGRQAGSQRTLRGRVSVGGRSACWTSATVTTLDASHQCHPGSSAFLGAPASSPARADRPARTPALPERLKL
ncbi:hypothetical protein DCC79_12535 [bacterium]|nr:MAG: hypothetical protein DCC79_12535 [bacterium]